MTARRIFWGSAFLLVGALLLASNLGYLQPFSLWGLWPILIIWPALRLVFGSSFVAVVDHGRRERIWVGRSLGVRLVALWILAGAAAQLLCNLSLIAYDWGFVAYWTLPVLLVGLGLAILARPRHHDWCCFHHSRWSGRDGGWPEGREGSVSSFAGDVHLGRHPWDFKSPMRVDLWAGDIDIDLSTARFAPGPNTLYVSAWAADVDVKAPEGIDVVAEASCSAGQVEVFDRYRSGLGIGAKAARRADAHHGYRGESISGGADEATEGEDPAAEGGAGAATNASAATETAGSSGAAEGTSDRPRLLIKVALTFGDVRIR